MLKKAAKFGYKGEYSSVHSAKRPSKRGGRTEHFLSLNEKRYLSGDPKYGPVCKKCKIKLPESELTCSKCGQTRIIVNIDKYLKQSCGPEKAHRTLIYKVILLIPMKNGTICKRKLGKWKTTQRQFEKKRMEVARSMSVKGDWDKSIAIQFTNVETGKESRV